MGRVSLLWGFFTGFALITTVVLQQYPEPDFPQATGPCQVGVKTVTADGLDFGIYFPQNNCSEDLLAPYPAVAFAHGFSFFGLSDGAGDNSGNGTELASWGYIVAVPTLPDDAEARIKRIVQVLDFLEAANDDASSFLYQQVDPSRFAAAGHSLGGSTALAVGARDRRIKAVVALDPVYHARTIANGEYPIWDPALEGPNITAPTSILGAQSDACNSEADYEEIYPVVGSTHRASYEIIGASHCVFADPGNAGCDLLCGGIAGPEKTQLSQKYMTAWLNYYLQRQPQFFGYLYGAQADADISAGRIKRLKSTSPENFSAQGLPGVIKLDWTVYEQGMISGYHIYRRLPGQPFPSAPYAYPGLVSGYWDTQAAGGQPYIYMLRSYDPAGNQHDKSAEAKTQSLQPARQLWMPFLVAP